MVVVSEIFFFQTLFIFRLNHAFMYMVLVYVAHRQTAYQGRIKPQVNIIDL